MYVGLHDLAVSHTHTRTHTHYEWSVQDQYIFIHDAILESVTCGDTQIEASNLRVAMRKLNEVPHNSTGNGYQQQFSVRAVNISPHMLKLGKPSLLYL